MNESVLITGANVGLGKEAARQLASQNETKKIILGCRNEKKAEEAKKDLEKLTGRSIFQIAIMDVTDAKSVKSAVDRLDAPIDALIMNAGGMGGKTPGNITSSGMNEISAQNLLGHVVLLEELLNQNKLTNVALYASSEAARGIDKMGMKRPNLKSSSEDEFASILDGSYFGSKFDPSQAYGHVKYVGTLWMSSLAKKHPNIRFISMSPGATSGTAVTENLPLAAKFMFKYVMMPIVMPLRGMIHSIDKGARRYVEGIGNESLKSGTFYASPDKQVVGEVLDQSSIFPDLANPLFQKNADNALHRFVN